MPQPYSQSKALVAIIKASFKAIFSQPASVVFSLLFPIVFILIFGAFGNGGGTSFKVAIEEGSDTTNFFYAGLKSHPAMRLTNYKAAENLNKDLEKGQLTAAIRITRTDTSLLQPRFKIDIRSTSASGNTFPLFMHELDYVKLKYESNLNRTKEEYIQVAQPVVTEGRKYKSIDFVLPGQIGFSILFATLFGVAFTFYTLREQLVLKRFYASPVNRINVMIGIGISRLFFQLLNVVVLIAFGHYFLGFTLQHGFATFLEMILLSVVMLFLLMGVGLIISSMVKSDSSIPLLINLFGFPQMLLSGTFFPITVFPVWLQKICYFLPLTQFNDAMRKISFEGLHTWDCWEQLGILAAWTAIIYIILARVIKWE